MALYRLIKGFVEEYDLESIITETRMFKEDHYNEANLASHVAYLSDAKPNRTSSAFAVSLTHGPDGQVLSSLQPYINLNDVPYDMLGLLYSRIRQTLGLCSDNRVLFNVQEYYGGSEAVPKHCDGELLDFDADTEGVLNIKRSIRPDLVAVLTLINDTEGGGTRIHFPEDSLHSEVNGVVRAEAGDLLVFNNAECFHSVDPLKGKVLRPDGLLRMTIGWRSLGDRCHFMDGDAVYPISKQEAETLTDNWYRHEWPQQWAKIGAKAQKAAF